MIQQIKLQVKTSVCRVIIGGGDGSFSKILDQFIKSNIDIQSCLFGILPLGTGNDLSRQLGWGSEIKISSTIKFLKK